MAQPKEDTPTISVSAGVAEGDVVKLSKGGYIVSVTDWLLRLANGTRDCGIL